MITIKFSCFSSLLDPLIVRLEFLLSRIVSPNRPHCASLLATILSPDGRQASLRTMTGDLGRYSPRAFSLGKRFAQRMRHSSHASRQSGFLQGDAVALPHLPRRAGRYPRSAPLRPLSSQRLPYPWKRINTLLRCRPIELHIR